MLAYNYSFFGNYMSEMNSEKNFFSSWTFIQKAVKEEKHDYI